MSCLAFKNRNVEDYFDQQSGRSDSPTQNNLSRDYCHEMDRMVDEGCPNFIN